MALKNFSLHMTHHSPYFLSFTPWYIYEGALSLVVTSLGTFVQIGQWLYKFASDLLLVPLCNNVYETLDFKFITDPFLRSYFEFKAFKTTSFIVDIVDTIRKYYQVYIPSRNIFSFSFVISYYIQSLYIYIFIV